MEEVEGIAQKIEEVKVEQPIIETPVTTKLRIVLGSNVDNGKDVVFDPITMNPKKLASCVYNGSLNEIPTFDIAPRL